MSLNESQAASDVPKDTCDIVMKGGITSGVVYPLALVELSTKYRFANIGGTSAGAMAAAAAAAAEYGRDIPGAGFERLELIPGEVGRDLLSWFQPTQTLRPLFDILVASQKGKTTRGKIEAVLNAAAKGYSDWALIGGALGLILATVVGVLTHAGPFAILLFGALLGVVGVAGGVVFGLFLALTVDLPANDYGVCPGVQQPGGKTKGFTDWLADVIDEAAGRKPNQCAPLTFGDLLNPPTPPGAARVEPRKPIHLAMMTTCLTELRPYSLSTEAAEKAKACEATKFKDAGLCRDENFFVFRKDEWEKLFPPRIIEFMTRPETKVEATAGEKGEFYRFPKMENLPVVVAARMSLSFPGLISAVPLWRKDPSYNEKHKAEREIFRRCLFSDGGLSSNFPIHFFDHLLPNTPTFAISLDEFDETRSDDGKTRTWLPSTPEGGVNIQLQPFSGLSAFLMRLVDSAKDWQDNLQSVLPGYRERIVHIGLTAQEGGLNLTMAPPKIKALTDYGRDAGIKLRDEFNFNDHRWRRFLVAMARLEETLDEVKKAYDESENGEETFKEFLAHYGKPAQYPQDPKVRKVMEDRAQALANVAQTWRTAPTVRADGNIPKPDTNLRISSKP